MTDQQQVQGARPIPASFHAYALLGALGLLGLVDDLVRWQSQIGLWVDAWARFADLVGHLTLGWALNLIGLDPPDWWGDYVIVATIVGGGTVRAMTWAGRRWATFGHVVSMFLTAAAFWPAWLLVVVYAFLSVPPESRSHARSFALVFAEAFLWAAVVVILNYALLAGGD